MEKCHRTFTSEIARRAESALELSRARRKRTVWHLDGGAGIDSYLPVDYTSH